MTCHRQAGGGYIPRAARWFTSPGFLPMTCRSTGPSGRLPEAASRRGKAATPERKRPRTAEQRTGGGEPLLPAFLPQGRSTDNRAWPNVDGRENCPAIFREEGEGPLPQRARSGIRTLKAIGLTAKGLLPVRRRAREARQAGGQDPDADRAKPYSLARRVACGRVPHARNPDLKPFCTVQKPINAILINKTAYNTDLLTWEAEKRLPRRA